MMFRRRLILAVTVLILPLLWPGPMAGQGGTTVLYDGSLGTLPGAQGFDFIEFPAGSTQTWSDGGVILDTTGSQSYSAGYFGRADQVPLLARDDGFRVTFTARVAAETHSSDDRAGFSIIVLSDDAAGADVPLGIELAFWTDEIWAQDDDTMGGVLFTHAEGVSRDTTLLTTYDLAFTATTYALKVDGATVLTGRLRDYTNFTGFPDVYETPNFLFLGDDTTSAAARLKLDWVAITPGFYYDQFVYLPLLRRP